MSRPLSIKFASMCAFEAPRRWRNLIEPTAIENRHNGPPSTFDFAHGNDYPNPIPFSGSTTWARNSPMGVIRKGTGSRSNEVLISFRGSYRKWDDYIGIDCATALGTSPKGYAVHGGFAKAIQSCLPNIIRILRSALIGRYHTVHCVGHSMGGALATLCAEHFIESDATPYLYSFGAPRVGMLPHARFMQNHLGERLNRYYYAGDVVTWLPPFPFVHMTGKRLISPGNLSASHVGYMKSKGLLLANRDNEGQSIANSWDEAKRLINQGENAGGGCGMEGPRWRCFTIALHKILYMVGVAVGITLIPCITVIDQIISCISYFVTQNPNRRPLIIKWLVGSFKALGKVVSFGKDKFVAMLRYILNLMLSSVNNQACRELDLAARLEARYGHPRPVIRFNT